MKRSAGRIFTTRALILAAPVAVLTAAGAAAWWRGPARRARSRPPAAWAARPAPPAIPRP